MTVYFPDSPGDCPIGMNCSVSFCADGADALPHRSALIPTSTTTNFRTVISPPLASLTRRGTLSLSSALGWPLPCVFDRRIGSGRPSPPSVVLRGGERPLRREGRRP